MPSLKISRPVLTLRVGAVVIDSKPDMSIVNAGAGPSYTNHYQGDSNEERNQRVLLHCRWTGADSPAVFVGGNGQMLVRSDTKRFLSFVPVVCVS